MWDDQGKWVTCRKIYIPSFLCHFLITSKCFILRQTSLKLDIWLQSYKQFVNTENNIKQKNLNTVFANISKTIFATSDSFLLIMSQMGFERSSGDAWTKLRLKCLHLCNLCHHTNYHLKQFGLIQCSSREILWNVWFHELICGSRD